MSTTPGPEPDAAQPDALRPGRPAVPAPAAPAATPARRRRLVSGLVLLAALVLVLDQVTKVWALAALTEGERTPLLGDLLGLQLLFNPGAALGLATGTTWLLTVVALTVVVVIIRVARRLGSVGWAIALGLLLGGALGNLTDRMIREPGVARGHVVDFIAYGDLFVGNVADIAIVAAAGLLMILSLRGVRLNGTREGHDAVEGDEAAAPGEAVDPAGAGETGPADPPERPTGPAEHGATSRDG